MSKCIWRNKDWLKEQYIDLKKSMHTIGLENGVGETCIHKWLHRFDIAIRTRSVAMKGLKKSEEHKQKLSDWAKTRVGILNPNYSHGKSKKNKQLRFKDYRNLRQGTFERDGFECVECGYDGDLEMHHIQPVKQFPELATDKDNVITLCRRCHKHLHFSTENFANSVKPRTGNAELSGVNPNRFFEGSTSKCVETIYETVSNN
jgi:5-methylcytosine-specific restriction endonuclease McrA